VVVTHHLRRNEKPPKHAFLEIKHENFVKKSSKYVPVRVKANYLSTRIIFVHSQTRVTSPLRTQVAVRILIVTYTIVIITAIIIRSVMTLIRLV
jgi:hypothetical protein